VGSGMFQNGTCHLLIQLSAFKDVFQMLCDGGPLHIKEFCHLRLGQPDGFIQEYSVDFNRTVIGFVEDDLGFFG
jgi:hypothetical protein